MPSIRRTNGPKKGLPEDIQGLLRRPLSRQDHLYPPLPSWHAMRLAQAIQRLRRHPAVRALRNLPEYASLAACWDAYAREYPEHILRNPNGRPHPADRPLPRR